MKGETIRLGAIPSTLDKRVSVWVKEQIVIAIVACFVDYVLWDANQEFLYIIKHLKSTIKIGTDHK